jgi:NAD-dependent protein deacetylase/lipoamidase
MTAGRTDDVGACIERAAGWLRGAARVVATTGAGMSKESGIPTFRDAPSALWENYRPEDLATRSGFRRDPARVWCWYAERRAMIALALPHEGHTALARMEAQYEDFLLLTQNIDNLHTLAGSTRLIELHGNIFRYKCFDRDHPGAPPEATQEVPPRCACGSYLRPDVVWFGEALDAGDLERAYAALGACEVLLVVGTSGLVYPAAGFPDIARQAGAKVVEINPEPTPITPLADVFVRSGARDALPALLQRVESGRR